MCQMCGRLTLLLNSSASAGLAAVIIHAVGDLITPPNTVYQFWKISPLEVSSHMGFTLMV